MRFTANPPITISKEAEVIDRTLSDSWYIHHEVLAGVANLRTLNGYCQDGKLATLELNELIGDNELMTMDSSKTTLDNILVDVDDRNVKFIYRVKIDPKEAKPQTMIGLTNYTRQGNRERDLERDLYMTDHHAVILQIALVMAIITFLSVLVFLTRKTCEYCIPDQEQGMPRSTNRAQSCGNSYRLRRPAKGRTEVTRIKDICHLRGRVGRQTSNTLY